MLSIAAPAASAGTMVVYSCHTPTGRTVGTTGWSLSTWAASPLPGSGDNCATGSNGTLLISIGPATTGSFYSDRGGAWTFRAAQSTSISGFRAHVCGGGGIEDGGAQISWARGWYRANPHTTPTFMGCVGAPPYWANAANAVERTQLDTPHVEFKASCSNYCSDPQPIAAAMHVSSFRATILDPTTPIVSAVRGAMATNVVHAGVESLQFAVIDTGVGVFRAVAEVRPLFEGPWLPIGEAIFGGASCRPLRETAFLYEFSGPQPCPLALGDATIKFNNGKLGAGKHDLRVLVEDASGNRTVAFHPSHYEVAPTLRSIVPASAAPSPASNGTGASRSAQLRITVPGIKTLPSAAPFRIAGRLLDSSSTAIAGATLQVETRPHFPNTGTPPGEWERLGEVVTDAKGIFRGRVPAGASRSIRVTYVAAPDDTAPAATAVSDVIVRAQVTARTRRARVRNGHSAVFRGRVAGPLPPGGVLVALEAREPRRWVPVATTRRWVRTNAAGEFSLKYRFTRTFSPTTYRFRVVVGEDSAFQYTRGVSRTLSVRVRP